MCILCNIFFCFSVNYSPASSPQLSHDDTHSRIEHYASRWEQYLKMNVKSLKKKKTAPRFTCICSGGGPGKTIQMVTFLLYIVLKTTSFPELKWVSYIQIFPSQNSSVAKFSRLVTPKRLKISFKNPISIPLWDTPTTSVFVISLWKKTKKQKHYC